MWVLLVRAVVVVAVAAVVSAAVIVEKVSAGWDAEKR